MALTISECAGIVEELRQVLTGGFIQKIHQPRPLIVTLDVRLPGRTCSLFISADPRVARLHLTSHKLENPPAPPTFCAFLRAHLEGGRILEIRQEPGDRIVYLTIRKAEQPYVLVVALTGHQANVHVLNETHLVLRSLRDSRLKSGTRYSPPVLRPNPRLASARSSSEPDHPPHEPSLDPQQEELEEDSREATTPGYEEFATRYPLSAAMDARYCQHEQENHAAILLQQQTARIRKALKQATRRIQALQEDAKKTERFREYARYGELLKSHLHEIKKGQDAITLTDYYDPALPSLTLPLDPSKDAVWNMEEYFKKYRKFLGAQEHLQPRLDQARLEASRLEAQLAQLEQGIMDAESLSRLPKLPVPPGSSALSPSKQRTAPAQGYRTFTSADGLPILVGKTAKDNDRLTCKIATPDDLWLHARGTPGSHVIVRLEKGAPVPPETLKDAAMLALWFSDLRKSGKGEVIYTFRKFVRKAKGQKPGAVMVDREKSLWIEIKEDRLERVKGGTS